MENSFFISCEIDPEKDFDESKVQSFICFFCNVVAPHYRTCVAVPCQTTIPALKWDPEERRAINERCSAAHLLLAFQSFDH